MKVTKIKSKQSKHTSRTFSLFGRELEISDAYTNGTLDKAIAEVIRTFDGVVDDKCGTKRGHCKLQSKERHIGGLVLVTTWQRQCVTRESVSNTLCLPRAKLLLVPMNFFSSG